MRFGHYHLSKSLIMTLVCQCGCEKDHGPSPRKIRHRQLMAGERR